MRKRYICMICLLMALIVLPVMAAGSVQVNLNSSGTTLNRGDEVTITVSAEVDTCKYGGVELSFDAKVFELVSGEWLLADAFMKDFDVTLLDGAFAYTNEKQLTGDVFRFTMKVKDTAAFGESAITVNFDADGVSQSQTLTLKVACNHQYDNDCDESCNNCGETRTVTHAWDEGKVTTEPSCTAEGVRTFTCTACGTTKEATEPKKDHDYVIAVTKEASCTEVGEKTFACQVCSHTYTEEIPLKDHVYTITVIEEATCTAKGKKLFDCDNCDHSYEDEIPMKDHVYTGTVTKESTCTEDGVKTFSCSNCSASYTAVIAKKGHKFDHACDTTCGNCDYTREIEHTYSNRLSSNEDGHWYECENCGEILEMYPHKPGPEATEDTDQICTDCGFVLQPAGKHVHTPGGDWLSGVNSHWHQCSNCTDPEKLDEAEHTWDEGKTDEESGVVIYRCTVCGYPKMTAIPPQTDPSEPEDTTGPAVPNQPEKPQGDNSQEPDEGFPWWILIVVAGVLLLGGIIFVIVGILISKKQVGKYSQ